MKTLLLAAATLVAASLLSACQQDPQSATGPTLPLTPPGGGGTTTPAHPAITYCSSVTSHGKTYSTVGVMDTDGTHQTNIYTGVQYESIGTPTWSPTGGSITWSGRVYGSGDRIMAIDVSVNSSGVAVGSNLRTLVSWQTSDSVGVQSIRWCQQATTGKIAFALHHTNTVGAEFNVYDLCTVPAGGGTVTVVASRNPSRSGSLMLYNPTWSPDDSKIATYASIFLNDTGSAQANSFVVFNASTGAVTDSIPVTLHTIWRSPWSHSGLNELVIPYPYGPIYYLTPTSGSTPASSGLTGYHTTWSPNNSSVMFLSTPGAGGVLEKTVPNSTTASTVLSSFNGTNLDWRQN